MARKPQLAADTRPWRDPTAKPFVRIRNVTKKFGDIAAVADVSLDIYKGELFCLLGGSGSGKSTLLRMLAGFEAPTSGTIEIDGQDMAKVPPYNRPVNMMFQSYALFPHMSVAQNVAYGLKRDGLPRPEIDARVAELLQLVKLATRRANPTSCRADSGSAWRWPGRSPSGPSSSCSTNPSGRSTRSCAKRRSSNS